MQVPGALVALQDQGVIDRVVRPLKSGKEAEVFLIESEGELRVAKVYKSMHRSFKQRAVYTEGRKVRNTRDQRAIERRTRHGKQQEEDAWKSAEVEIIHRLHAAGVRVPTPYNFIDGVLIMELITDADGSVAPRLAEVDLDSETANAYYQKLLQDVVRMLCAGVIHGDLSDYNVLVDEHGPVVIDFPQAVDAAANRNAKKLLLRDVANLGAFLERVVPGTRLRPYGEEIWAAFENNHLSVDMKLSGDFRRSTKKTDVGDVLGLIEEADEDEKVRRGEAPRRRGRGGPPRGETSSRETTRGAPREAASPKTPSRETPSPETPSPETPRYRRMQVVETASPSSSKKSTQRQRPAKRRPEGDQSAAADGAPPKRRRRRRRRGNGEGEGTPGPSTSEAPRRREGRAERQAEPTKGAERRPDEARARGRSERTDASSSESGEAPRRRRRGNGQGVGLPTGEAPRRRDGRAERQRSEPTKGAESGTGEARSRQASEPTAGRSSEPGDAPRRRRRRRRGPPKPSE